jgi:hypothetical protein
MHRWDVEPSLQNGFTKAAAFPLEPYRVSLRTLRKIHGGDGCLGSHEDVHLQRLERNLEQSPTQIGGVGE